MLVCLLVVLLVGPRAVGDDAVLLKSRRFVPTAGVGNGLGDRKSAGADRIHVLLQLENIPSDEQRIALHGAGVNLLSYIPNRAWLSSIPLSDVERIATLPGVRAVTKIVPEDKIAPSLRERGVSAYSTTDAGGARLVAMFFGDVERNAALAVIREHGGRILTYSRRDNSAVFELPVEVLYDLATRDSVKWIDQHHASVDLNDGVRAATGVNAVQASPYDLAGREVAVGQWESRHPDANHVDLIGRVVNVDDGWPVGDHATQVAGTIVGDGSLLPERRYRGMAPAATLVSFHNWEDVTDLRTQYEDAIDQYDIDIANNSWGMVEWHVYRDYCAALDDIVRGAMGKRISIVCAAGNEGDWATIMSTAVGKNIVSVGAVNSDDRSLWPWSNKGPTEDGRLKPDMFANVYLDAAIDNNALVVPQEAVIDSGLRKLVFLAKGGGKFEPREVRLGVEGADNTFQVLSGLTEGDEVVTSAQFMFDSESRLREAIQKMLEAKTAPPAPSGDDLDMKDLDMQGASDLDMSDMTMDGTKEEKP